MNIQRTRAAIVLAFITILLLAGCGPAAPQAAPTLNPTEMEQQVILLRTAAAETVAVQLTEQAALFPSATVTATATEAPTHTAQPAQAESTPITLPDATQAPTTSVVLVPTATARPAANTTPAECKVVSVSPVYNNQFRPSTDFDVRITVQNTGTFTWSDDDMELRYITGDKYETASDSYKLTKEAKPGENVEFAIDMITPKDAGQYSAAWGLFRGSKNLCVIYINLQVVD
ncbi:hypothetical protein ADN00_07695 [Ornatilinea apprima]|uniref:Nbr1 FW domain-containing protein n=1 Tax=Ornatilinea apprima TaxID=1134406 RepID=A0A0P6X5J1_9CHLR|nr:NBR1-Ig-like domain-containing protein [Ornatilinea apprima]KPL78326.1 hypothetical protein ADN00_07695 [Ornatilinea apprima]